LPMSKEQPPFEDGVDAFQAAQEKLYK
jgi:hypothetical protein